MNIRELLTTLHELGEQEQLEAKSAQEVGDSILETVCSFSNEPGLGGGTILLGVKEEEYTLFPGYEVAGIDDPDKVINDLVTQCRTVFNVPVRVNVTQERIDGKLVIAINVPEAQPSDKPVFFQRKGLPSGAYRRIGTSDQRCTDDDLQVFYQGRSSESFDYSIIPDADLRDIDPEAIVEYRRIRAETNPDAEELQWGDEDLLQALGCLRIEKGVLNPTVAGILLFGTSKALRQFFPMMRVDYIRVPGKEWVSDPDERFTSIDMRGSLFTIIRRAQSAVLDDLPKAFALPEQSTQREERPLIPVRIIREALVNAVMHRNYRVHSPVQIIRYTNRLEVRNPGYSLKSEEHLGEPGSLARNPKIAAALHETRFAETKGSGIRVMRAMMEEAGLTPPLFESDRGRDTFVATYLFHHFLSPGDVRWLAHFKDMDLSNEEARALIFVREAGVIDNLSYRTMNKVDTLNSSVHLRRLRDLGLLEPRGKTSGAYYLPTPLLLAGGPVENGDALLEQTGVLSEPPPVITPLSQELTPDISSLSQGLTPVAGDLKQGAIAASIISELPKWLREVALNLGQRKDPDEVKDVIVQLCRWKALQASEISQILDRDQAYITRQYLTPLVRNGMLAFTLPDNPAHPQQAYKAVEGLGKDEAH